MQEIDIVRDSHLIDPHLHVWGWEVPVYLFLGGAAAGIMIFSALLGLRASDGPRSRWARWVVILAPALISVGMSALLLDLEYKMHVWRFYGAFMVASPMSWGSWILLAIYPITVGLALAGLEPAEVKALSEWRPVAKLRLGAYLPGVVAFVGRYRRTLLWSNVIFGAGLGIYTGILLGALGGARPAWNSALLGPLFLASGMSAGAALMMLLPLEKSEHHFLQRWDLGVIALEALLLFLFITTLLTGGGQAGRDAAMMFLGGQYTVVFWALVVIVGIAVPVLIEVTEMRKKLRPLPLAPIFILVGGLALRWILVVAGQA